MPMTDAERDELKTLIRETIREMAKETTEIWWNTPVSTRPMITGGVSDRLGDPNKATRPNDGSVDPLFGVPVGGPIGGWNERLDSR